MTDKDQDEARKIKIFLIKNEAGRFINVENPKMPYFTDKMWQGSFSSIKGKKNFDKNLEYLNKTGEYGELSLFETDLFEHLASSAIETSAAIITLDLAAKRLQLVRNTIPNVGEANEHVHNSLVNCSKKLKFVAPLFAGCERNNEEFTYEMQGNYDEMIHHLGKVEPWNTAEINELLTAYWKNKKTLLGSARRVNKATV